MQPEAESEKNINGDGITHFEYNEFHNIEMIGEGGFGKVYKAEIISSHDHRVNVVALKKLKKKKKDDCDLIKEV